MSNDSLASYLHDHLAGANFAIELLDALHDHHSHDALGAFAAELSSEIKRDRAVLTEIVNKIGHEPSGLKGAAGWLAEKASRLKLRHLGGESLGTFETLEALALGILGKEALWNALHVVAAADSRLQGLDYTLLATRARQQFSAVEARRLELAETVFAASAVR